MLLDKLSEAEQEGLLGEVGYSRRQLDSDLQQIKDWLKLQHHLPACRLQEEDSFLRNYLVGCKGSLEKAKRKIDDYYTFRSHTEIFITRDPLDPDYTNINNLVHFAPLPKLMKYTRLVFLKLADVDQGKFHFPSFLRNILDGCELGLRGLENYGVNFSFFLDGKGFTANHHIVQVRPLLLKDLVYYSLKTLPLRVNSIYVINAPQILAATVNNFVVPFLPKKLKSRLHITASGFEEMSHHFDRSVLPKDYGGDLPSMKELSEFWRDYKVKERDWYLNELSARCDESKRIVTQDPTNPYFGVPGSLKKLVVD